MSGRDIARASVVLLAALLFAGCAADPGPVKSSSGAATPATSGPTLTPVPITSPVLPFGGDCDNVLPVQEAASIVGSDTSVSVASRESNWRYPLETAGALFCTWDGADERLEVVSLPLERVPGDLAGLYSTAGCVAQYDWSECAAAREQDGTWMLAVFQYGIEIPEVPTEKLDHVLNIASDQVRSFPRAAAVTPTSRTWTLPECATLGEQLDLASVLGSAEVFEGLMTEGPGPLDKRIAAAVGSMRECGWSTLREPFAQLAVIVEPGAGWSFSEQERQHGSSESVDIAGAASAARTQVDAYDEGLLLTDTVNILRVRLSPPDGDADLAARILRLMPSGG